MILYKKLICSVCDLNKVISRFSFDKKRSILSAAYACTDDWNKRLTSPIFAKINTLDFMTKLKEKHDVEKRISAVDVDILANKLQDLESHQLDFAEEIFYSFRHTDEALNIIESTPHALLRQFIQREEKERILRILQDKVNYGIFLDTYSSNMLFDYFIKKEDFASAAEIAFDLMLQEDFGNELTKAFALNSCYQYFMLLPLNAEPRVLPDQAGMEVKYKRVSYIQPLWFDSHFDLANQHAKIGRVFQLLALEADLNAHQQLAPVLRGLEIVGLGLGLKFEEAIEKLERILKDESAGILSTELIDRFENMLVELKTSEPAPTIEPGLLRMIHLHPIVTQEQKDTYLQKLKELKPALEASNKLVDCNVADLLKDHLHTAASMYTDRDIDQQKKLYQDWTVQRESLVEAQIEQHKKSLAKKNMAERLMQLSKTEEKLRYFEEQAGIEMALHAAQVSRDKRVDLHIKEDEEIFVLPPSERKSSSDAVKKKKK